jgi:hypothetical protein
MSEPDIPPRVPKVGWVRFRWSRTVPSGVKSYRATMDRAGRWHIAFAVIPEPGKSSALTAAWPSARPCRRVNYCACPA